MNQNQNSKFAAISQAEIDRITQLELQLSTETKKNIILIAYERT